jgi:hypothetical protein
VGMFSRMVLNLWSRILKLLVGVIIPLAYLEQHFGFSFYKYLYRSPEAEKE